MHEEAIKFQVIFLGTMAVIVKEYKHIYFPFHKFCELRVNFPVKCGCIYYAYI